MKKPTKLTKDQQFNRQKLAKTHGTRPNEFALMFRSQCSDCQSPNIAWLSIDGYRAHLGGDSPQYLSEYPNGTGWVCLECDGSGFMADGGVISGGSYQDDLGGSMAQATAEVHDFNYQKFIEKFPAGTFSEYEADILDELFTMVNVSGLHEDYDQFFTLIEGFSDREFELAGSSISREIKVNEDDFETLKSMVTLALIAAPVVNAYAPETNASFQMPVLIKKTGKVLAERWSTNEFELVDEHRCNFVRGLLMRKLNGNDQPIGTGLLEDLYTQWIGANFTTLSTRASECGNFDYTTMVKLLGQEEANRFLSGLQDGISSLSTCYGLEGLVEEAESQLGANPGELAANEMIADEADEYVFTIAQRAFLADYNRVNGYQPDDKMPAYAIAENLGLTGIPLGGGGRAEHLILMLTTAAPEELEKFVDAVAGLNDEAKANLAHTLLESLTKVAQQEYRGKEILDTIAASFSGATGN